MLPCNQCKNSKFIVKGSSSSSSLYIYLYFFKLRLLFNIILEIK